MEETSNFVRGFKAAGVPAGLKKDNTPDLALIVSEQEATAAGMFTDNKVMAAPVHLTKERVKKGKARAIIVNSGNANACTGSDGLNNARLTSDLVAGELGINADQVLVASTGVIGQPLDMGLVSGAIPELVASLSPMGIPPASRAIMTTDSFPKISLFEGEAGGRQFRILGIAKGAGMIMPNMATMLCFVLSDINIGVDELKKAMFFSVEKTFNRITVDGDTSTNDTVLVMANGMAGNKHLSQADNMAFGQGLEFVMGELARMIVRDGEGATKVVDIEIRGAHSPSDAGRAAKIVANSSLVKTAFYGRDPNWGRIMAAVGRAGVLMEESCVDIWFDDVQVVASGMGKGPEAEKRAAEIMENKEFSLVIDLHKGMYQDHIITCDFTHKYITINADYRT